MNTVITNEKGFWDYETKGSISIIWLKNNKPLEEYEASNDLTIKRGNSVSSIKFSKAEKVKGWN
ncbi:hypothetical protein V6R21_00420 [Limibacter armeniacum]|uniref:hypothetical protein n=1 Tax=Limibacter armeniacum TaxID=466084 RepID=UPI002FE5CEF9